MKISGSNLTLDQEAKSTQDVANFIKSKLLEKPIKN